MSGTVAKGNRLQVMARKCLEADGYVVHTAVRSSQRVGPPWKPFWISQTTDIFNAFDLIATRMDPPRPLRFIQVTTRSSVSERIKKVDPVPINAAVASVEIWAYVGGQRRLDRRFSDKKVWLARNYFQVYFKERNWEADSADRILPVGSPTEVSPPARPAPVRGLAPRPIAIAKPRKHPRAA